jgi:hypothetical protein
MAAVHGYPPLDAREQTLDAWAVVMDSERLTVERSRSRRLAFPSLAILFKNRDQVLGTGQKVNVRFLGVEVSWQPLVSLARDRRQTQAPAETERAVARAGIVREGELRPETAAAGRRGDRHAQRAGAGHGIGSEFLADAPNGPAALRQLDRRRSDLSVGFRRISALRRVAWERPGAHGAEHSAAFLPPRDFSPCSGLTAWQFGDSHGRRPGRRTGRILNWRELRRCGLAADGPRMSWYARPAPGSKMAWLEWRAWSPIAAPPTVRHITYRRSIRSTQRILLLLTAVNHLSGLGCDSKSSGSGNEAALARAGRRKGRRQGWSWVGRPSTTRRARGGATGGCSTDIAHAAASASASTGRASGPERCLSPTAVRACQAGSDCV